MSDAESTHSEVDATTELTVVFTLTSQIASTLVVTASNSRKSSTKTQKETKSKEGPFTFAATSANYLAFLRQCLIKHKQDSKFKVPTEQQAFKFKYYFTPGRPKTNALDVEGLDDYVDMVKALATAAPRPLKVTILLELTDVERSHSLNSANGGGGSQPNEGEGVVAESELTRQLARIRRLIESKYGNENDQTIVYTFSDGHKLRLTPVMVKEWARHIYDAIATINEPPNTEAFDPTRRRASLTTRQGTPQTPGSAPPVAGDLSHLAAIMSTMERLISGISGSSVHSKLPLTPLRGAARRISSIFSTPSRHGSSANPTEEDHSSLIFQPADITLFLRHAQDKLGVQDALTYETALQDAAFGPDILSKVSTAQLTDIGIKAGDAVRLQEHASTWWNHEALSARKRSAQPEDDIDDMRHPAKRPCISYRTSYIDGGEKRWYGEPPVPKEPGHGGSTGYANPDIKQVEYYNDVLQCFCPVPDNFMAREEGDFGEDDIFSMY